MNVKTAVVLATALVVGVGQPLSAQTHPSDSLLESAEGPIARAAALELAKLEASESFTPFERVDTASTADARVPAAAARRSKAGAIGAVIGAAAGAVLGVGLAVSLAYRQCGSSCSDEKALIAASLIGIPIGGGVAGYYIGKGIQ